MVASSELLMCHSRLSPQVGELVNFRTFDS
jgi:hypothetical protein